MRALQGTFTKMKVVKLRIKEIYTYYTNIILLHRFRTHAMGEIKWPCLLINIMYVQIYNKIAQYYDQVDN